MMGKNILQKCFCYFFLKALLIRTLWNTLLPSFILHRDDFGDEGQRNIILPYNHRIIAFRFGRDPQPQPAF